ncbi:CHASE2 domain-containing protein [Leptothoe sp. PORK10 BA2]|uniref:CHASE2 domain-containing protein n=1 Tax=Leptothoe sp. PORK10 BA2 TaxID=3110254 RepID=UPI002B1F9C6F|nr:CHASE2 domain-containing protein [Leptothoe sp. PORK10 BA2]MEA5464413.1 CHASE2 domain-containing protein [Leptothoe sp. PORK10 BA2]
MSPLVVLNLGTGNCETGLSGVTARLWLEGNQVPVQYIGSLPPAPALPKLYREWQRFYEALHNPFGSGPSMRSSIEFEPDGLTNVSRADFWQLCEKLKEEINNWLHSPEFRTIDQQLRTQLDPKESIRFIIETEDLLLQKLPWHLWQFFEHYGKAEIALSVQQYGKVQALPAQVKQRIRILVILGHSKGINVQPDRMILEDSGAETIVLNEPMRAELNQHLWDEKGWDIFFFAGHSTSRGEGQIGELFLNGQERLSIDQLRHALKAAISRGLKLAIFNSCDGLGLARALADLNLPQLIVMREPVVDQVAHTFLQNFLQVFARGEPFYTAVRTAREQLQGIETKYPCASWLPVIFQNPTEAPLSWQRLSNQVVKLSPIEEQLKPQRRPLERRKTTLRHGLLASLAVTIPLVLVRALGLLQPVELRAYDHLVRARPTAWDHQDALDSRLLVVEIDEKDTNQYGYPVKDDVLAKALATLADYQPRAIGVDMHRYQANEPGRKQLIEQFNNSPNLITVCSFDQKDRLLLGYPPEFSTQQAQQQVGFSDLETDGAYDRNRPVVRRQLLSYSPRLGDVSQNCVTPYSLSLSLALRFLQGEGTEPLGGNDDEKWQLGPVVFDRLATRAAGYQQLDGQSSQILLNYRFTPKPAPRVSLTEVLAGQVGADEVRDRIVLMGVIDPIGQDYQETPYGQLPGVWVHAHGVSHLLSAVLDQRPLMWMLPQWGQWQWGDMLWIWGWAMVGGVLGWRLRSTLWLGIGGVVAVLGLRQICLVILVQGGWVPFIPALLALAGTAGLLLVYRRGALHAIRGKLSNRLTWKS